VPTGLLKKVITSNRWFSVGLLVVSVWALLMIGRSDFFFLTAIPVEGAETIPDSEIVAGSGLSGTHVFAADPNAAAIRISEIPGVISSTVTLEWPNKVAIKVIEDDPIALWEQAGKRYWVNEHGHLIPARENLFGLVLIESESAEAVSEQSFVPGDVVDGALLLRNLRPNIDRLYYRPGNGLSYQDGRGWRAYFGTGLDMEQKLAVYETIVDDLLSRSITPSFISVRNQQKPFYKVDNE
jgi:cell division septal protein FtsQ